jgi:hypothetical protein
MVKPETSTVRFGKHPPVRDYRTLRFRDYVTAKLPAPPASFSALPRVFDHLGTQDLAALFPMDGNDTLGDCTIAALAHAITLNQGFIKKKPKIMSTAQVVKLYYHLTGGVDSGLAELNVLNYWRQHKVSADQILAYISVDPKNHEHVQQAAQIFGSVYLGFQVQAQCLQEFNAHKPWTPGRLTKDGHAVLAVGYDPKGLTMLTWGSSQEGTWAWWDECVDEAYAIVPPEAKNPGFAPGFDVQQLLADLNDVAD